MVLGSCATRRLVARLGVAICAISHVQPALAGPGLPVRSGLDAAWERVHQGHPAAALEILLPLEAEAAMDPTYNSLVAAVAMRVHDYAQATLALERLVLQQPENAGAWLDLAIASVETGDLATARRALDHLERDVVPPPAIRKVMEVLRWRILLYEPLRRSAWRVDFRLGHDTNANGGLSRDLIPITVNAVDAELPVDPDSRARSDNLASLALAWMGSATTADARWEAYAGLDSKRYAELGDYDTDDLRLSLARVQPGEHGAWVLAADARYFALGGNALMLAPALRAAYDYAPAGAACRLQLGLGAEWRRYRDYAQYDSDLYWLDVGGRCPLAGGELMGQLRLGSDRAADGRPGGDNRRAELALSWRRPLPGASQIRLDADYTVIEDDEGYSPLLEDNAARRTRWLSLRGEYAWPLSGRLEGVVSVEVNRQRSNLPVFELDQEIVLAGLRYSH